MCASKCVCLTVRAMIVKSIYLYFPQDAWMDFTYISV